VFLSRHCSPQLFTAALWQTGDAAELLGMVVASLPSMEASDQGEKATTDQEYLVSRARAALLAGNSWEAKTWMLTARAIFPQNFDIQFEAYTSEKEENNVKESAKCLETLFAKFPDEEKLVREIHLIMETLRRQTTPDQEIMETENKFYIDMFEVVSENVQKKMIICAAEKTDEPLEHCKLMLILMQRFKSAVMEFGEALLERVVRAEEEAGEPGDPLSPQRHLLVVDILPTVLSHPSLALSPELLLSCLYKTQEFVLATAHRSGRGEVGQPWPLLYRVLASLATKLGWAALPAPPRQPAPLPVLDWLEAVSGEAAGAAEVMSSLALHTVSQYSLACKEGPGWVLLEAWVAHQPGQAREKAKRRKTVAGEAREPVVSQQESSTLETAGQQPGLLTLFQQAVAVWTLLTASPGLEAQFCQLVARLGRGRIGRLDWLDTWRVDYALYCGQAREATARLAACTPDAAPNSIWSPLKLATLQFCLGDPRSAAAAVVECVTRMGGMGGEGTGESAARLTLPTCRARHCRLLPLTRPAVLTYCCRLLTSLLQDKALQPGPLGDTAAGQLITIIQYNWPEERELFHHLLSRVRTRETFSYPLFCNHVVNIEILQEVMFLASEQGGGLLLDILGTGPGQGGTVAAAGSRPGTRGANRGEREEFKNAMRRQAARSNESIEQIIVDFLTGQTDLLLQTLA